MKKLIFVALMFSCISTFAQGKYFTLDKSGFVSSADSSKQFVVIPFEGKTQSELYKLILNSLNGMYVSPKDVLNPVESESVSVNAISKYAIHDEMGTAYNLNYTLVLLFKDGRLRVDAPVINKMIYYGMSNSKEIYLNAGSNFLAGYTSIWNKKGAVKEIRAKQELEAYFDKYIDSLLSEIKKAEEW